VSKLFGPEHPIAYEDTQSYFKLHAANRRSAVFARLQLGRRQPVLSVPLSLEEVTPLVGDRQLTSHGGWTAVPIDGASDLSHLSDLFQVAYGSLGRGKKNVADVAS